MNMGKKILIVEDEMIIAEDINVTLQKFGYDVVDIVPTGSRAMQAIKSNSPDLVLMDIKLRGDIDGVQTAKMINENYDIPIVYLTANADLATYEEAKLTSPFGYLIKPFKERELHATIEMAFFKSEAEKKIKESRNKIIELHKIAIRISSSDTKKKIINVAFEAIKKLSDSLFSAFIKFNKRKKIEDFITQDLLGEDDIIKEDVLQKLLSQNSEKEQIIIEGNKISDVIGDKIIIVRFYTNWVFLFTSKKQGEDLTEQIYLVELLLGHVKESFKRVELEDKLRKMAIIDNLTGCYNRHYLDHIVEREIKQSKRYKSKLAVMMVDVNYLKKVNDNFGHNIGDFVIRKVADIILSSIRESDIAIRYGGDEFLIIMPRTGKEAEILKNRISENLKTWNLNNSHLPFPISIAIGYSYWEPNSGLSLDNIISMADKEMYKNKKKIKEENEFENR
jgi:diguanylate cyclase (GGDEF)-like protein